MLTSSDLDPTWWCHADVIQKARQKTKLSIFLPKFRVFLTFCQKTILRPACILRSFSHQPAEFKPKIVGALNAFPIAIIDRSYQVFIRSSPLSLFRLYNSPKNKKREGKWTVIAHKSSVSAFILQGKRVNSSTKALVKPKFHNSTVCLRIRKLRTSVPNLPRNGS